MQVAAMPTPSHHGNGVDIHMYVHICMHIHTYIGQQRALVLPLFAMVKHMLEFDRPREKSNSTLNGADCSQRSGSGGGGGEASIKICILANCALIMMIVVVVEMETLQLSISFSCIRFCCCRRCTVQRGGVRA